MKGFVALTVLVAILALAAQEACARTPPRPGRVGPKAPSPKAAPKRPPPKRPAPKRSPPPSPIPVFDNVYSILDNSAWSAQLRYIKFSLETAGLAEALKDPSFTGTVFFPIDGAFISLLADITRAEREERGDPRFVYKFEDLLKESYLGDILKFHVVPDRQIKRRDFTAGDELETLFEGHSITVKRDKKGIKLIDENEREVGFTVFDVQAGNATVHLIRFVLAPDVEETESPSPSPSPVLPSPSPSPSPSPNPSPVVVQSLYDIISVPSNNLTTLKSLVDLVGEPFVSTLKDTTAKITVFAPNNNAFATLLAALGPEAAAVSGNKTIVAGILSIHVIPAAALSTQLTDGQQLPTLVPDLSLTVKIVGGKVHIIVPGSNNATVILADVKGGDSVAHVIDHVLLPPTPAPPAQSLYEIISAPANGLTTLKSLVDLAGEPFVSTLKDTSAKITVFAPTNAAFGSLLAQLGPAGAALAQNQTAVAGILSLHVVAGTFKAANLQNGQLLPTLAGVNLRVTIAGGVVSVGLEGSNSLPSKVVLADVTGGVSVAHAIDRVILPPMAG